MSFQGYIDYFSFAGAAAKLAFSSENKNAQNAEAKSKRGDIIARDVYGEKFAPSSTYRLATDLSITSLLGSVTTPEGLLPVLLAKISVKTKFATPPEIELTGASLQTAATATSTVNPGTIAVSVRHQAQILMAAFTLAGDGCELNECNLEASIGEPTRAEIKGDTIAHDVSGGTVMISATVIQSGATAPTITAAEGWDMTAPESVAGPENDYEVWTFELTKSLTGTDPVTTTTTTAG